MSPRSAVAIRLVHDAREGATAVLFATTAWAIGTAAMMGALWLGTRTNAVAVHMVLLPAAFVFTSFVYFRRPAALAPIAAALVFGSTVLALDAALHAIFRETWGLRDFVLMSAMPAYGAAAATWLTGADLR